MISAFNAKAQRQQDNDFPPPSVNIFSVRRKKTVRNFTPATNRRLEAALTGTLGSVPLRP